MSDQTILILVVEDEALIQHLLKDILEEGGFVVEQAANAQEALNYLSVTAPKYRALITDVDLGSGETTGWDIARRAREVIDGLPVIYMTGASAHDWSVNGVPNSIMITKPFAPAQVVTALSQLLNVGNTPGV